MSSILGTRKESIMATTCVVKLEGDSDNIETKDPKMIIPRELFEKSCEWYIFVNCRGRKDVDDMSCSM